MENQPKLFNNTTDRVVDDLRQTIAAKSKVSIIAASFSIYAYQSLRDELDKIEELRFIFSGDDFAKFTAEKATREAKQFEMLRLNRERGLYGTEYELKLKNELNQKAIARECADWIRAKVSFKANVSKEVVPEFLTVENNQAKYLYNPLKNFTTGDLGENRGNFAFCPTIRYSHSENTRAMFDDFNTLWDDDKKLADVTDAVLDNITAAYEENSPEFVYYLALYNIFSEFLDDINADFLPDERTGFKQSAIWQKLYKFQKDAVVGCISKLERHNGCILADSVGLGKTFSALGVIKYYESRNKNVLVLCPKRLTDNWNTFKHNYKNNPVAADRLRYDVLYHTDLDRERGESNGLNLAKLNWDNYDLVVIDESHNFRNGESTTHRRDDDFENRFQKLLNRVIKSGVKTKVLMLSATPVNLNFTDLKNQLLLACEGDLGQLDETLETQTPLERIISNANRAFRDWSSLEPAERTTQKLLDMLSFDFFKLLDSVSIARSRKHIQKYYNEENLGKFPTRLKPVSHRPNLTDIEGITYQTVYNSIDRLNLKVYNPLEFVFSSKLGKYIGESKSAASWANREQGRNQLFIVLLLKRLESSIEAFRLTATKVFDMIDKTLDAIDRFEQGRGAGKIDFDDADNDILLDAGEEEGFSVGKDLKIDLADMDILSWREKLEADKQTLKELLETIKVITPEHDTKLQELLKVISEKVQNPLNEGNKKVLVFAAFADTIKYLYVNLNEKIKSDLGLHSAMVSGSEPTQTTLPNLNYNDFNAVLTCFSPKSKERDALFAQNPGDIDILFGTDCISEGQNLQDCDYLVNYDIHWNPVRIIQRFGRIDRIGSHNDKIQLVNFWLNISLEEYLNLKARVENRMSIVNLAAAGNDNILLENDPEAEYRKKQLEKLETEVPDLEDISEGVSIMDLGLNEFHLDLQTLDKKYRGSAAKSPHGIHSVVTASDELPEGVIFVLKNINSGVNIDKQNRLHPFYLVYIKRDGETFVKHLNPKDLLDKFRFLSLGKDEVQKHITKMFNTETKNGKRMDDYSALLGKSIETIIEVKKEKDVDSLFSPGGTSALENEIKGLDDFELIDFLIIKNGNE